MAVDPDARYVPLEGLSMAIVVISIICVVCSVAAVGIRTYARLANGLFGVDDALVLFGTVGDPQIRVLSRRITQSS